MEVQISLGKHPFLKSVSMLMNKLGDLRSSTVKKRSEYCFSSLTVWKRCHHSRGRRRKCFQKNLLLLFANLLFRKLLGTYDLVGRFHYRKRIKHFNKYKKVSKCLINIIHKLAYNLKPYRKLHIYTDIIFKNQ